DQRRRGSGRAVRRRDPRRRIDGGTPAVARGSRGPRRAVAPQRGGAGARLPAASAGAGRRRRLDFHRTTRERNVAMNVRPAHALAFTVLSVFVMATRRSSVAQQPIRIGASMALTGKYSLQGGYGHHDG